MKYASRTCRSIRIICDALARAGVALLLCRGPYRAARTVAAVIRKILLQYRTVQYIKYTCSFGPRIITHNKNDMRVGADKRQREGRSSLVFHVEMLRSDRQHAQSFSRAAGRRIEAARQTKDRMRTGIRSVMLEFGP